MTVISYEPPGDSTYALGMAASVQAPVATPGATSRETHDYAYTLGTTPAGETYVATTGETVAGEGTENGWAAQDTFDTSGYPVSETGADGVPTSYFFDETDDRLLTVTDHHAPGGAGEETSYAYDAEGRLVGTYGPTPPSCLSLVTPSYYPAYADGRHAGALERRVDQDFWARSSSGRVLLQAGGPQLGVGASATGVKS
jgi:YD repeat-containing protein